MAKPRAKISDRSSTGIDGTRNDAVSAARQRLDDINKKIAESEQKRDSARTRAQRLKNEFDRIKKTGATPITQLLRSNHGILIATSGLAGSGVGFIVGHAAFGTAGAIAGIPFFGVLVFGAVARFGFNASLYDIDTTRNQGRLAVAQVKEHEAEIARLQEILPLALERVNETERIAEEERLAAAKSITSAERSPRRMSGELVTPPVVRVTPIALSWENLPPTDKQIGFALSLGIRLRGNETRGQVSQLIDTALAQRNSGHTTQVVVQTNIHQQQSSSRGVAILFNLIWPGIGQIYQGRAFAGLFFMFCTPIGYLFLIIPGLILHVICILDVALYRDRSLSR